MWLGVLYLIMILGIIVGGMVVFARGRQIAKKLCRGKEARSLGILITILGFIVFLAGLALLVWGQYR